MILVSSTSSINSNNDDHDDDATLDLTDYFLLLRYYSRLLGASMYVVLVQVKYSEYTY